MSSAGYVAAAWSSVTVSLGLYAWRLLRRGRRLSALVPPEERRWS